MNRLHDTACRRRPRARAARAFTLVEILLALMILVAGVAGIYGLLGTALGMQRRGLDRGMLVRRSEAVVHQLEQDVAAGLHRNAAGSWDAQVEGQLPDGTLYRVELVPETGREADGTLLAHIRLARSARDLADAPAVSYVLSPGSALGPAVRAWDAADRAGAPDRSGLDALETDR